MQSLKKEQGRKVGKNGNPNGENTIDFELQLNGGHSNLYLTLERLLASRFSSIQQETSSSAPLSIVFYVFHYVSHHSPNNQGYLCGKKNRDREQRPWEYQSYSRTTIRRHPDMKCQKHMTTSESQLCARLASFFPSSLPLAPEPGACCGRGCLPCIYDLYATRLRRATILLHRRRAWVRFLTSLSLAFNNNPIDPFLPLSFSAFSPFESDLDDPLARFRHVQINTVCRFVDSILSNRSPNEWVSIRDMCFHACLRFFDWECRMWDSFEDEDQKNVTGQAWGIEEDRASGNEWYASVFHSYPRLWEDTMIIEDVVASIREWNDEAHADTNTKRDGWWILSCLEKLDEMLVEEVEKEFQTTTDSMRGDEDRRVDAVEKVLVSSHSHVSRSTALGYSCCLLSPHQWSRAEIFEARIVDIVDHEFSSFTMSGRVESTSQLPPRIGTMRVRIRFPWNGEDSVVSSCRSTAPCLNGDGQDQRSKRNVWIGEIPPGCHVQLSPSSCAGGSSHQELDNVDNFRAYTPIGPLIDERNLPFAAIDSGWQEAMNGSGSDRLCRGHTMDFLVRLYQGGALSSQLWLPLWETLKMVHEEKGNPLPISIPVYIRGPLGRFRYPPGEFDILFFVCGGTGITPCYSILAAALEESQENGDHCCFSILSIDRTVQSLLLTSELAELVVKYPDRILVQYVCTREKSDHLPQGYWTGTINGGKLRGWYSSSMKRLLRQTSPTTRPKRLFLVSGNDSFCSNVYETLLEEKWIAAQNQEVLLL